MIKVTSNISSDHTDLVEGFIYESFPSPWAITVNHLTGDGVLIGYFSDLEDRRINLTKIEESLGYAVPLKFTYDNIADQDWKNAYKHHFKPWSYKKFHLVPLWLKQKHIAPIGEPCLYLDPGMAFGTGNHESTRLCMEFLLDENFTNKGFESLIDLGCGSGILALTSNLIGFKQIIGLDNDEDAIRISQENASLNSIDDNVRFKVLSLENMEPLLGTFDCVVANIQADILIKHANKIVGLCNNHSTIILSGILCQEANSVIESFKRKLKLKNLKITKKTMGEWASIKLYNS